MRSLLAIATASLLIVAGCVTAPEPASIPEPDTVPLRCPACGQSLFYMDGMIGTDIAPDTAIPPPAEATVPLPAECLTPRCQLRIDQ